MPPDEIRAAHAIVPLSLCELEWSLFARDCERDLIPTCRELGLGILAYRCLPQAARLLGWAKLRQLHACMGPAWRWVCGLHSSAHAGWRAHPAGLFGVRAPHRLACLCHSLARSRLP